MNRRKHSAFLPEISFALIIGIILGFAQHSLRAADTPVPHFIAHQGELSGTDATFTGTGQFKFALVSLSSPVTAYWKNDNNSISVSGETPVVEPASAMTLPVSAGAYGVFLGYNTTTNLQIAYGVFSHPGLRVRTWFRKSTTGAFTLQPDLDIPAAGYAMQIPDGTLTSAKIAAGAVTSAQLATGAVSVGKIASGAVGVTNLAASVAPVAGQVLSYASGKLSWSTPSSGIWNLNGTGAFYNGGNVGVGTNTPAHRLSVAGGPQWTSNGWKGAAEFESGAAIGWKANTSGKQFGIGYTGGGLFMFHTNSASGTSASPAVYEFAISDVGNVGIGTSTPAGKLEIAGAQDALRITGYQPVLTMRDSSNNNVRSAIQSVGGDMNFFTENYLQGTNPYAFLKVANNGNVGVGSANPVGKLEVVAQDALRMIGYQPFLTLFDSNAGYARGRIQSVGGVLNFFTETYLNGSNTNAYAQLANDGAFSVKTLTIRGGADVAEPFQMKEDKVEKGSVVVIDELHPGRLKRSSTAYDRRVAGIVSGANGVNPGIALHQEGLIEGGQNVALSGRVYVRADTSGGAIRPGDMLTTSDTPGCAMKVEDHARAQGAVIGKAMSTLEEGEGMVLVLVTLQ